jgi:putative aldouronate transport system substrate-binding protein
MVPANGRVSDFAAAGNAFTAWYEQRTNVRIEWEVVETDDAPTVLRTRLLAGELPDMFLGFNAAPATIAPFTGSDRLVDLAPLVASDAPLFTEVAAAVPEARSVIADASDAIWSLPRVDQRVHLGYPRKLFIYRPWLETLGLQMPATTDEFRNVLIAFRDLDPNGNGRNDQISLSGSVSMAGGEPDVPIMNAFVFNPGAPYIYVQDGEVTASYVQEGWREGIAYLRDLFDQRLIDRDAFTQRGSDLRAKTGRSTPQVGVAAGIDWSVITSWNPADTSQRWAEYALMPALKGPSGQAYAPFNPNFAVTPGSLLVTTACADPALACRWADGLYDLETTLRSVEGPLDKAWRWAMDGEVGIDGKPAIWARMNAQQAEGEPAFGWAGSGPSYRSSKLVAGAVPQAPDPERTDLDILSDAVLGPARQPDDWWMPALYPTADQAVTIASAETMIMPYVRDALIRWVTGEGDVGGEWQGFRDYLDSVGVNEYLAAYQAAYDERPQR